MEKGYTSDGIKGGLRLGEPKSQSKFDFRIYSYYMKEKSNCEIQISLGTLGTTSTRSRFPQEGSELFIGH